ncbi:hypothetical protein [Anabaena azotica]|uniref:hypothetical protein n=1 Tax=Anabaena azotica TaxID=197653 RepID=UPI0039A496E4
MKEPEKTPLEAVLNIVNKGIEKISNEILIFLLCYPIVLIVLWVYAKDLFLKSGVLFFYIIPFLAVGYYLLSDKQKGIQTDKKYKNQQKHTEELKKMDAEKDVALAKAEAEIRKLKQSVKNISDSFVKGVVADRMTVEELAAINVDQLVEGITQKAKVIGFEIGKSELSKAIEELNPATISNLKILIEYLPTLDDQEKKILGRVMKNINDIPKEKLIDLGNFVDNLTRLT